MVIEYKNVVSMKITIDPLHVDKIIVFQSC